MFKTLMLLCVIGQPDQCLIAEDITGLKATEAECYARGVEMAKLSIPLFPVPMQAHFKCEKQNGV